MQKEFSLGDHVVLRKPHACGGSEWEIIRVGADIKLKCVKCGRVVMLDRGDFIRSMKTRKFDSYFPLRYSKKSYSYLVFSVKYIF